MSLSNSTHSDTEAPPRPGLGWRITGLVALATVLALQWENLMALCGF